MIVPNSSNHIFTNNEEEHLSAAKMNGKIVQT